MTEYLYHYTSVETLEKILENRSFRFSSLSTVDDMYEGTTKDFGNFGRFVYVSCWTDNPNETSSLWSEYTGKKGVRIKLPKKIFPTVMEVPNVPYQMQEDIEKFSNAPKFPYTKGIKQLEREKGVVVMPREIELFPITYTEDPLLISLSVFSGEDGHIKLDQQFVGRFKSKSVWGHQSEWRYKMFAMPFSVEEFQQYSSDNSLYDRIMKLQHTDDIPFNFADLPVDEEKFKDMEIVTSSLLDDQELRRVDELIQKYCPTAEIRKSSILLRK